MATSGDGEWGPWNCKDCRKCGRKPAFTEVTVRDGEKVERQMCDECARDEGIGLGVGAPINELISKFVASQVAPSLGSEASKGSEAGAAACPGCGMTFAEFRNKQLLGCAECYEAFAEQLGPLIERAHDGAVAHVGKAPKRSHGSEERQRRLSTLRRRLSEAVASEEYERAAALRDEILGVEHGDEIDGERGDDEAGLGRGEAN